MPYRMKIMPRRSTVPLVAVLAYDGVNAFELGMAIEVFGRFGARHRVYKAVVCAVQPRRRLVADGGVLLAAGRASRC